MKFKIVGIGELLWDLLPGGPQLGGAPANFTYHACALGAEVCLISGVGDDQLGRQALSRLMELAVPKDGIEIDPERPTGTVSVTVGSDGQPQFEIHEDVAWDALTGSARGGQAVAVADAVCFGTLAQRHEPSRSTIRRLVGSAPKSGLRILDVNLRQDFFTPSLIEESLALANVLKLNDTELPVLAGLFKLSGDGPAVIQQLARRFDLRGVAYTQGRSGSLLYFNGFWSRHPGIPAQVVDTVGAGDAFTAAMTVGLLSGWALDRVNDFANRVASYVCAHAGATPHMPDHFRPESSAG